MSAITLLTTRNLHLFFRDRAGVFFSLLSALILIVLYALFLGNLQVDNLTDKLPGASSSDIHWFVDSWVFAGITMITTMTTALAALSTFVDDKATDRFRDFLVSPVRRSHLIFGYFLSSFIVSVLMTVVIVVVGQLFLFTQGHPILSPDRLVQVVGFAMLSSAAYAAVSSFIVTFLRTSGAFAALSTVVGTIIGFLAGAYIPVGTLPSGVVTTLNALPFAQSAMLLRGPYTDQAIASLAEGAHAETVSDTIRAFYGVTASIGNFTVTTGFAVGILCAVLVVFSVLGGARLARGIR
ncbi:ABC transporter permease [Leifsonia sp. LS1]|uniref:ABC transporter permease n=1 Tax=Leifsonia sp. LS1 TaxID=2828483 RepID=UPI001CFC92E8|nr:ABC transporter permease [Leifsonia sp. LS1]GIT78805.1 ABC transporter permease [Leifsonia sp. LS1]